MERLIMVAGEWRQHNRKSTGVVVIYDDEVCGWLDKLRSPDHFVPGAVAIDEDGEMYIAKGGDDYNGADRWESVEEEADMTIQQKGDYLVDVKEDRRGVRENEQGLVEPTYNCYAGYGYEIDDNGDYTGYLVFWAGNGAWGEIKRYKAGENGIYDLDDYLSCWDDNDFVEGFKSEGVMEDI